MGKGEKFANEGYTIYVLGKHFQITEAIRNYVWEKLSRVERVADHIIDIHVTPDTQKHEHHHSIFMTASSCVKVLSFMTSLATT